MGGVCGSNSGTITNCSSSGEVEGNSSFVGGVCGYNDGTTVTNCYNTGKVTGKNAGGVCGWNYGTITNCYWLNTAYSTGIGYGSGEATSKTAEAFASGEVAYLLNGSTSEGDLVWKQTLGIDDFPNFTGLTVVRNEDGSYSNQMGSYTLAGYSLSLAGDIGVNFYMDLGGATTPEGLTMHFTLPNGTTETVSGSDATELTRDGTTYYGFTCHVAAKEMTADITAQLYQGEQAVSGAYTYTVRDYADYILAHPEDYENEQTLVKNMLNYGAYAQTYFNYNTENLANEDIGLDEIDMNSVTADTLSDYASQVTGSVDGITYYGTSLVLESKTTIRHYFTLEENASIDDYTFQCGEKALTAKQKDGMYYVDIADIPASALDSAELTVKKTGTEGSTELTIRYSVYTYVYRVLYKETFGEDLENAVRALYLYGEAAKDYFEPAA